MFSGKTTALLDIHQRAISAGKRVVIVNFAGDLLRKTSVVNNLVSHSGATAPCLYAESLSEVWSELCEADVVLINEAQFFPDARHVVLQLVNDMGKEVHLAGLDGDFRREPFGTSHLLDLIPQCDEVVKLRAVCCFCAKPAIFSRRLTDETEQVVIGGSERYAPVCRSC